MRSDASPQSSPSACFLVTEWLAKASAEAAVLAAAAVARVSWAAPVVFELEAKVSVNFHCTFHFIFFSGVGATVLQKCLCRVRLVLAIRGSSRTFEAACGRASRGRSRRRAGL